MIDCIDTNGNRLIRNSFLKLEDGEFAQFLGYFSEKLITLNGDVRKCSTILTNSLDKETGLRLINSEILDCTEIEQDVKEKINENLQRYLEERTSVKD
ncbi:MAG: DUF1015 domain-containing protein [Proteobacteria bacterium]|nr:DUF1015 domain-containing protein [Pseudomonadota bacterium]